MENYSFFVVLQKPDVLSDFLVRRRISAVDEIRILFLMELIWRP